MSEKPYVICHMTVSIDGKVTGEFLKDEGCFAAEDIYYRIHRNFHADAFACGRVTMEGSFTGGWYPDLSAFESKTVPHEDYIAETDTRFFAAAFDRRGRLGWKEAKIHDDDPGYDNAHIIEVLEEADDAYLAYLRKTGISYIFADTPAEALIKLKKLFGINTLLLEGGSVINGAFERDQLIDELSLVMAPLAGGEKDAPLFDHSSVQNYELLAVSDEGNSVLHLKYRKK